MCTKKNVKKEEFPKGMLQMRGEKNEKTIFYWEQGGHFPPL